MTQSKTTIRSLLTKKINNQKITALTAYDFQTASLIDEAGIDIILVGDSLGNVCYGFDSTIPVTMEMMKLHTLAVTRAVKKAYVIADMPFGSYHRSVSHAVENAVDLMQLGASAVKVEGLTPFVAEVIDRFVEVGIPVVGHLGFTPQQQERLGGAMVAGRTEEDAHKIIEEAKFLEKMGVCMLVLEMIPEKVAKQIASELAIPVIGIGAGKYCDGQILVYADLLGLFSAFKPKFVKRYAQLNQTILKAFSEYKSEVESGEFPSKEYSF